MKKFLLGIFAALLALSLVLIPGPAAQAADFAPGDWAYVQFTFKNIYGISGDFVCDTPELVASDISYSWKTNMTGDVANDRAWFEVKRVDSPENITITLSFKLSSKAKVGDKCTITFYCDISDKDGNVESTTVTKTVEVTVLTHPTTQPTTKPTQATTKPTIPTQPTTQPTEPTEPSTQPTQPTTQHTIPVQPTTPEQVPQTSQCPCDGDHSLFVTIIVGLGLIILFLIGIILSLLTLLSRKNRRRK